MCQTLTWQPFCLLFREAVSDTGGVIDVLLAPFQQTKRLRQQILHPFQLSKILRLVYWCPNQVGSHQGISVARAVSVYCLKSSFDLTVFDRLFFKGSKIPFLFRLGGSELNIYCSSKERTTLIQM